MPLNKKQALGLVLWGLGLLTLGAQVAGAATGSHTPGVYRYPAVVKCGSMAEDTAAHLRLVRYDVVGDDHLVLVYHCKHLGY